MMQNEKRRVDKADLLPAGILIAAGVAVSSLALIQLEAGRTPLAQTRSAQTYLAQATPPLQSTPGAETRPSAPEEPKESGARPHDVPPQPARPDGDAVQSGAQPALPPAPPEKLGEPIRPKGG